MMVNGDLRMIPMASGIKSSQYRDEQVRKLQKMYVQQNKFDRMPDIF